MTTELYNQLFESRQEGDYDDLVYFDELHVRPWIAETQRFVERIEELLKSSSGTSD